MTLSFKYWSVASAYLYSPGFTRHDYASILLKLGVKDRITQEMLRHAQYSTTASIYQHVAREDHFAAAQAVQNWIERALA